MFGLQLYKDAQVVGMLAEVRGWLGTVSTLEALFDKGGKPCILYTRRSPPLGLSRIWFNLNETERSTLESVLTQRVVDTAEAAQGSVILCEFGGWGDWYSLEAAVAADTLRISYVRRRFPWRRRRVDFFVQSPEQRHLLRLCR
jgi:hypothetical protein